MAAAMTETKMLAASAYSSPTPDNRAAVAGCVRGNRRFPIDGNRGLHRAGFVAVRAWGEMLDDFQLRGPVRAGRWKRRGGRVSSCGRCHRSYRAESELGGLGAAGMACGRSIGGSGRFAYHWHAAGWAKE